MKSKAKVQYLVSLAVSVLLALVLGGVIMALTGHDPLEGYSALITGALGTKRGLGNTLAKTATLCLTGLATAVAAKAGIFNVGGEGQLYLGAIASAYVGAKLAGLSPWIGIPLCLLAAMAAGGVYAVVPAILKVKLKVSEVITTIMLNSAAIYFCSYLANGPLKTAEKGVSAGTDAIDKSFMFSKLIKMSSLTESIFIAAFIALFVWYLMSRTTIGYEMQLTGQNSRFARYSGIKSDKLAIGSMVLSGAICGLVGMFEVFGQHGRFIESVSKDFYFDGMLVAMIMHYKPFGIILMSFFFGILQIGSTAMESRVGISSELILIVQSIIIFFMAAEEGILASIQAQKIKRNSAARIAKEATEK
ncbi:MAG: ABC transporter permease [Clostridia bacterium]|nr:ABC transporter permease [Clostridia bacterium]